MSADTIVKSYIDRILRLKEEQDSLAADIREVYAEAKGNGYDKTALGEVVSYLRKVEKKGKDACEERDAAFGMYLDAYERASSHTYAPARAREIIEEFDPETGEVNDTGSGQHVGRPDDKQRDETRVPGSVGRGEGDDEGAQGQRSGVAGTDRRNGPVEGIGARQDQDGGSRHVGGETRYEINQSEGGAFVAVTGSAQLTNADSVEPPPSDTIPDDDVPAFLKTDRKTAADYRPHCQHPEACGSSGLHHCYTCQKAIAAESEAA